MSLSYAARKFRTEEKLKPKFFLRPEIPPSSLPHHVWSIPFILADAFHQFHVREEFEWDCYFPWSRVRLGIIDRDFKFHVAEIPPVKTFNGVIGVTMRMPAIVDPGLIIEALRIDHECVAFPFANRIAQPGGVDFLGKTAPVREDLTITSLVLKKNQRYARRLEDLERRCRYEHGIRYSMRQTASGRTVLAEGRLPLFV